MKGVCIDDASNRCVLMKDACKVEVNMKFVKIDDVLIVPALKKIVEPVNADPDPEPIPATVDVSCEVEMYPIDANPCVVDVISAGETAPKTTPVMLLTFSVSVLIDFVMSCCVDTCASKAISFHSTEF